MFLKFQKIFRIHLKFLKKSTRFLHKNLLSEYTNFTSFLKKFPSIFEI